MLRRLISRADELIANVENRSISTFDQIDGKRGRVNERLISVAPSAACHRGIATLGQEPFSSWNVIQGRLPLVSVAEESCPVNQLLAKICQEMAGRVLELQRGFNTPARRLELADELQATIEKYLAFEKRKSKSWLRKDR